MNITDYKEIWQVDAGGQIYEASFEEMAQWIFEGSILPQDMVKRGNLRWIEAASGRAAHPDNRLPLIG